MRLTAAALMAITVGGPMWTGPAGAAPSARTAPVAVAPSPVASPTVPTLTPYVLPHTPFDGPVGGEALGVPGRVVSNTPDGVAPVPVVPAGSFVVADLDTGEILAAKDAHAPLPPASTIKTLTALTVLDALPLGTAYLATDDDVRVEGSRVGIVPGQSYTVEQLCYGLLLSSGNDAALALGSTLGGQSQAVDKMNVEAERLGAYDTHAVNTHGLDEPDQVSSAYDLALIARAGLQRTDFRTMVATKVFQFPGLDGNSFQIQNQNRLLGKYPGAMGVKTGFTTNARHTFVAAAERDGRRLLVTVMKVHGRGETAAAQLLDWAFAAAGEVEPVGRLVTPDEVAAVLATASPTRPADGAGSDTETGLPPADEIVAAVRDGVDAAGWLSGAAGRWAWPLGLGIALTITTLVGFGVRRRRARGRYSATTRDRPATRTPEPGPPDSARGSVTGVDG